MNEQIAVHAMGNGSFLLYGRGADVMSMHPGDYSTPSIAALTCADVAHTDTRRTPGTNTWTHTLRGSGGSITFCDALDPQHNLFRRTVCAGFATRLHLDIHPSAKLYHWADYAFGDRTRDCMCVILPKGTLYFTSNVTVPEYRLYILCDGCVSMSPDTGDLLIVPGEGAITLIASRTDELELHLQSAVQPMDVFERSGEDWRAYFGRISNWPQNHPRLSAAVESVAALIRAQQSRDGGIVAGHFYPMAYVRDQAGAARGLLRMGLIPEAKAVVNFWMGKFQRFGCLYNAEAMGHDDARLMFSNDRVEVPAYVLLTAFACAQAEGGRKYLQPLLPMLRWAAKAQAGECAGGMTGFSGDETYIAGGMFPRCVLYQGSAESTMLMILSLEKYLAAFGPDAQIEQALAEAKATYRANYVQHGRLMANQPARLNVAPQPRFHMGYCESCLLLGRPSPLTWLEKSADGLYRCPDCRGLSVPSIPARTPMELQSVGLLPAWHGFDLITDEELLATAEPYINMLRDRGDIASAPGGNGALGYDYALLLTALTRLNHPAAMQTLDLMLDRLDEAGAWSEYYRAGQPYNCRCRPWESGMNIAASLNAWDALKHAHE